MSKPTDRSKEELNAQQDALGEAFYRGDAKSHRDQLYLRLEEAEARDALREATGIEDGELLTELAGLGIRVDTLAAFTLIPLIAVAWSDGVMDGREREAVLDAAVATGINRGTTSYRLLEIWTEEEPAPAITSLWRAFANALCAELESAQVGRLRENILGRARAVAAAAGDSLDRTPHVSSAEEGSLAEFAAAFE